MAEYVTAAPEGPSGMTLSLTGIKLHSPSAIIGTPLDPSSRFEYPFPSPQPEYEPHHPVLHSSRSPSSSSNFLAVDSSSFRQRQSHVHPKHDVREVPIPPTLDKRVNIELRFPHPMEGVDVLRQAHTSIKRRKDTSSVHSRNNKKYPRPQLSTLQNPR